MDKWVVEYKYEDDEETVWTPIGLTTHSLEEATDWLSTVARLHTTSLLKDEHNNFKVVGCIFRLKNETTDEIIPAEIFVNG